MQKIKRMLCVVLCVASIFVCFTNINVSAVTYPVKAVIKNSNNKGVAQIYSLPGTTGHEIPENKDQSKKLCDLADGTEVIVLGEAVDGDGDMWYKINYGENFKNEGYAYSPHVVLKPDYVYDEEFEKNLQNFPESYREALKLLHAKYPNWKFIANKLDLSFKAAVEAQYGVDNVKNTKKWVEHSYYSEEWIDSRARNTETGKWLEPEPRWTYASRTAIEYYMDPRNSLDDSGIFVFMQQSYQEDAKMSDNLRTIVKGTFLEKGYDENADGTIETNAYIDDLIAAGKASGVSPYVLASTIITEQGKEGTSDLISGKYPSYEGYYNFYNYASSGSTISEIVTSGLTYAKNNDWNSREAAIVGGAKKYADGYIAIGQDTYYYKDFNVINKKWDHQYAAALYDAWTNASLLKKGCLTNYDASIVFSIPVFNEMPEKACPLPTAGSSDGDNSGTVTPTPPPAPTPTPTPTPPPAPVEPVVVKGDVNGDGKISIVDHASIKRQLLGVKNLEGTAVKAADINGDGKVSISDLAAVKRHLLGIKPIS